MSTPNQIADLTDDESTLLWNKLEEIMQMSDQMAEGGSYKAHCIYKLARDCRDLLMFDQQSREISRRLTGGDTYAGLVLNDTVKALAKAGRKIEAIKELRNATGSGLKEAKDAVEEYQQSIGIPF